MKKLTGARPRIAVAMMLIAAFGASQTLLQGQEEAPPRPDFSGSWELNVERSDDLREKLRASMRGREPQPGTSGFNRGGRSGTRGKSNGVEPDLLATLEEKPRVLTIEHDEPLFRIVNALSGTGYERVFRTDGAPVAESSDDEVPPLTGRWLLGQRLQVEQPLPGKRVRRETWELVAEGSRIIVSTEWPGTRLMPAVRGQQVYDRVEIVPWDVPED